MKRKIIPFLRLRGAICGSRGAATRYVSALLRLAVFVLLALCCAAAGAQANEWTWMSGSSAGNDPGVYSNLGQPATGSVPGGRSDAASWTDTSGHLWLFGGQGYPILGMDPFLNDLWEFNPSTSEWTWVAGSNPVSICQQFVWCGEPGVYGVLGKASTGNLPGSRSGATTWTDKNGHLWLLGGYGFDASGQIANLNDLWEFDPSTKQWAWRSGSSKGAYILHIEGFGQMGVYGKLGTPAPGNVPGSRQNAVGWSDRSGNLWLFGGDGEDSRGVEGLLNDVWKFNPSSNEWTWMGGASTVPIDDTHDGGYPGVYGTAGTAAAGNIPGGRSGASIWTDSSGNLWLFGGWGYDEKGNTGFLNDLWKFNPSTGLWAWMLGASNIPSCGNTGCGALGVYGTLGVSSPQTFPGARTHASTWREADGSIWLFGGTAVDAFGQYGSMSDLWTLSPSLNQWTWMGGDNTTNGCWAIQGLPKYCGGLHGTYGSLGTPAVGNIPGGRVQAATWSDASGKLWLFGGDGFDATHSEWGVDRMLNDLWSYQPSTTVLPPAVLPAFSVPSGTYGAGGSETIANGMATARFFYTTDGTTPTAASTAYHGSLTISKSETVRGIATAPGYRTSGVASVTYVILKPQTITFPQPPTPINFGGPPITLKATASSGLPVSYSVEGDASVSGSTLTLTGAGTLLVFADQDGNSVYDPATTVLRTIVVNISAQTITFPQPPTPVTYGVAPITLKATASSGLPVGYSVYGPAKASGSTLTITGAGNVGLQAYQGGNSGYSFAPEVARYITVNRAALTVTANNLSMKAGSAVPALTYVMSGFVNGDTQGKATTGAPKLTTTATSKSAAGKYPITVAGWSLASANYGFSFVNGTLTVTK